MEFSLPALNPLDVLIAVSVFGLIAALWLVGFFLWLERRLSRKKKVEQRLGLLDEEIREGSNKVLRLWHDGQEATTQVVGNPQRSSLKHRLERLARDAGMEEG